MDGWKAAKIGLGVVGTVVALASSAYLSWWADKNHERELRKATRKFNRVWAGRVMHAAKSAKKNSTLKIVKGKVCANDQNDGQKRDYTCRITSIGGQPVVS